MVEEFKQPSEEFSEDRLQQELTREYLIPEDPTQDPVYERVLTMALGQRDIASRLYQIMMRHIGSMSYIDRTIYNHTEASERISAITNFLHEQITNILDAESK